MNMHVGHIAPEPRRKPYSGHFPFPLSGAEILAVRVRTRRARLEAVIEQAIAMLDAIDGDTDFEPANDDEPSLGGNDDREEDCEDEGSQDDREYSCGWIDDIDQSRLGCHGTSDESEPDLGWPEQIDQIERTKTTAAWVALDGEVECEDEGAQCDDEGAPEYETVQP